MGEYLFIGLDNDKHKVIGFKAETSDLDKLGKEIENSIKKLPVLVL